MKIIEVIAWRDGGSITLEVTNGFETVYYFIDNSITTVIKGKLYSKHFDDKNNREISPNDPVREELKVALADYKKEYYEEIIQHLIKTL